MSPCVSLSLCLLRLRHRNDRIRWRIAKAMSCPPTTYDNHRLWGHTRGTTAMGPYKRVFFQPSIDAMSFQHLTGLLSWFLKQQNTNNNSWFTHIRTCFLIYIDTIINVDGRVQWEWNFARCYTMQIFVITRDMKVLCMYKKVI